MWTLCLEEKVFPHTAELESPWPFTWANQEGPRQPSEGVVLTWGQANIQGCSSFHTEETWFYKGASTQGQPGWTCPGKGRGREKILTKTFLVFVSEGPFLSPNTGPCLWVIHIPEALMWH